MRSCLCICERAHMRAYVCGSKPAVPAAVRGHGHGSEQKERELLCGCGCGCVCVGLDMGTALEHKAPASVGYVTTEVCADTYITCSLM